MEKKKIEILIIIIILCIFSFIVIFFNKTKNDKNVVKYDDNLKEVTINSDYFTVQNIINDYYEILKSNDKLLIYNTLDIEFIKKNSITEENVLDYVDTNYGETSFIATNEYIYKTANLNYYFIKGNLINESGSIEANNQIINENINYLVTVNYKNNKYSIFPLEDDNYKSFIKTYSFKNDMDLKSSYKDITIRNDVKLSSYINYFLLYLMLKPELAYDLLSDNAKLKYNSVSKLEESKDEIIDKLTPVVFSYTTDNDSYIVTDNNLNTIIIKENKIMDYNIDFSYYEHSDLIQDTNESIEYDEEIFDY